MRVKEESDDGMVTIEGFDLPCIDLTFPKEGDRIIEIEIGHFLSGLVSSVGYG